MRRAMVVLVGAALLALVIASVGLSAQAPDFRLWLGTWKLNVAKSTYEPGPPPMSETRVYEAWEDDGVKATFIRVQADGTRVTLGYSAHHDGKDYKYTGSPDVDTIALNTNDDESKLKKRGKVVLTVKGVMSSNGKVWTLTVTGMNAKGQKVNHITVFDKQ
jgi:hypothetical protein